MASDSFPAGVVERLKAASPKSLNVQLNDGSEKVLAIPAVRRKWVRVKAMLANLDWQRIECLDAKGAVSGIIDNPDARERDDTLDLEDLGPESGTGEMVAPLLGLMLRAQDVALNRQEKMVGRILDANAKLLEIVSQRLLLMERAYQTNLDRTQDYAEQLAQLAVDARGDDDGDLGESIMKALPGMLKMYGDKKKGNAEPSNAEPEPAAK